MMSLAALTAALRCAAAAAVMAAAPEAPEPTGAARRAAEAIRREALLPPNGPAGRPLPLASHWNVGSVKATFEPAHQIELIQRGCHVLPWCAWPRGDPSDPKQRDRFMSYYGPLLGLCRKLKLPLSMRGTQWEAMLVRKDYREGPIERWAGVLTPEGQRMPKLSPFGAIEPWKDPAKAYVDTPGMKKLQEMYPDPPLVLWVSNNEAPDLRWHQMRFSKRYQDKYGKGRTDELKRKVVSKGWMERYPVMFAAMREALVSQAWRKNVRFIGYGAFGPSHFGRWGAWKEYSLITDEWTSPDWHIWDGGSPSYYTHNWCPNRDHWVWSTQVQSMNWVFQLEEAWRVKPSFWFEISTWDGNEVRSWLKGREAEDPKTIDAELLKKSKALQYLKDGQDYPPRRALGWVQFGLWLLRPRAVREFRGHATPLEPVREYWLQTVKAVDRVHAGRALQEFWRFGRLVHNRAHRHPYQEAVPEKYKEVHRWFLLDTNLDPPRPWTHQTNLPVFSMALVRGEKGSRRWLLYAHSPLADRKAVRVTVPDCRKVTVDVPRGGAFYRIDEATGKVSAVEIEPPSLSR
jgi:hypothetical protein